MSSSKKKICKKDIKNKKISKVLTEFKDKTLNIGKSKKKVKKRSQAIAIALSQSRKIGSKKKKK